jgi:NitT/TauT family transport system ATP-binding protein
MPKGSPPAWRTDVSQPKPSPPGAPTHGAPPTEGSATLGRGAGSSAANGAARPPAVVFEDVHTKFSTDTVLDGVSFEVGAGEFVCLLGPSGCGKSTTLRIAGNLLTNYEGSVRVQGLQPADAWPKLAYVFQSPRLVPWRTALSNVMLGMELRHSRLSKKDIRARALEKLTVVGLQNDVDKYPAILSGGERQRVSIARALAVEPEIILMDEPLSALDAMTKGQLRDEIVRIWHQTGKTIVFVTHDVDEALHLADKLVVFSNKPTSILEQFDVTAPRPRRVESDSELQGIKRRILDQLGVAVAGGEDQ